MVPSVSRISHLYGIPEDTVLRSKESRNGSDNEAVSVPPLYYIPVPNLAILPPEEGRCGRGPAAVGVPGGVLSGEGAVEGGVNVCGRKGQ